MTANDSTNIHIPQLKKNPKARVDPKAFVEGRLCTKQDSGECFLLSRHLAIPNPGSETHMAQGLAWCAGLLNNNSTSLKNKVGNGWKNINTFTSWFMIRYHFTSCWELMTINTTVMFWRLNHKAPAN